ncbi:hypothetical protein GDO78_010336 [Eleutherodactylus coqui]|uniref:Coiled-coil domain-containing protein 177 n=1 Tax=Eleutherodactylus coqui TaxID=57060 RepID=A0A8J6F5N9_ELECQ|nr:hypothetical protein GDO78_010336 [Eleutherodactylus coqui]
MIMADPTEDPGGEQALAGASVRQREHSPMLHLDLYNFECLEAEGSRYVLTSPRSLEACARCMVKPVELLSRSLSELVKEAPGRSMRVATGLCEVYEIERQRKLKMCREERERIVRQEKRRILPLVLSSNLGSPCSSKAPSWAELSTPPISKRSGTPSSTVPRANKSQSLDSLQKMRDSASGRTSSESMTSSYSGDSFRGRTTQLIPKSRTLDTVNSLLGRSFSLGDLSHSPQTTKKVEKMVKEVKKKGIHELPTKDKKIAAIMIAKHEEEKIMKEQRYWAHLQWETQRKSSDLRKELEERGRQRALLQGQRMLESRVRNRRSKMEVTSTEMEKQSEGKSGELEDRQRNTSQIKSQKSKQLKKSYAQELSDDFLQDKYLLVQQKKQERFQQLQVNKILQNKMEKVKHQALRQDLAQKEESDTEERRMALTKSLHKAQENVEQLLEKRNQEIKTRAQREEQQSQRARQAAEQREKKRAEHLKELAKTAERRLQHAAQVADEVVQHKARKAVEIRLEKEKIQRENRQKVQKNEDIKRQELLMSIEKKLERSEQIFKDKQTVLDNARLVARASFNIREKVRAETNTRTFDKMVMEAEFYANIDKK